MSETRIVVVGESPEEALPMGEIAEALLGGAVAAYPTETFYALGAAAFSRQGVERIYRLKGRDASKPSRSSPPTSTWSREIAGSAPGGFRRSGRRVLAGAADPRPPGRRRPAWTSSSAPAGRSPSASRPWPGCRALVRGARRAADGDERQPGGGEGARRPGRRRGARRG
ncbi:MAG: Sua5/YciO/YrdC/YwlC family protein [Candidatus Moduliflexus flocculans]|nr:Sua5/YciO/YrdC/YwlC family protein [Candidatus Moduliflexus flocculans]